MAKRRWGFRAKLRRVAVTLSSPRRRSRFRGAFAIWRYHKECESRSDIASVARSLRDGDSWGYRQGANAHIALGSDPARLASAPDIRKVVQISPHGSLVEVTAAVWGEIPRGVAEIAHGTCDLAPSRPLAALRSRERFRESDGEGSRGPRRLPTPDSRLPRAPPLPCHVATTSRRFSSSAPVPS